MLYLFIFGFLLMTTRAANAFVLSIGAPSRYTATSELSMTAPENGSDRRSFLGKAASGIIQSVGSVSATAATISTANAACLPGDQSPDCIGIYKVPIDDRIGDYVGTPEKLKTYAPDMRWVPMPTYPKTYTDAMSSLKHGRERCAELPELVRTGKLEKAGVEILGVTPNVTVAGTVVLKELPGSETYSGDGAASDKVSKEMSLRGYRAEVALSELEIALGQCDIILGQGMRGELGAPAPAQLQVLEAVKAINEAYDEVLRALPDTVPIGKSRRDL